MELRVRLKHPHKRQLKFLRSKAKRKIIKAGRRGGKTTGLAIYAVEQFLAGHRVLYATPTADQIQKFWAEVCLALAEPIKAGLYKKNETNHTIELVGTNQRIRAKTAWNADTLRGDFCDVLILDEWQLMNEDAWEVVGAPMLIDNNGDAVFIYTPPSLHSKSVTKATDIKHAGKMFAMAKEEMELAKAEGRVSRWEAFHFTSLDNPFLSVDGLDEVTRDMTALAYRQEILAEESDEAPGALWKRVTLSACNVRTHPELTRLGIGVDPPGGATVCGIVAAGIAMCNCKGTPEIHAFVLEDGSLKAPPNIWANRIDEMYETLEADVVVAEKNFGGDMVKSTILTANADINCREVHASRGKAVRAEPVAALYEQGKVHHVGQLKSREDKVAGMLEDELCGWMPDVGMPSPNRLDALVWILTDLMLKKTSRFADGAINATPRPPQSQIIRITPGKRF